MCAVKQHPVSSLALPAGLSRGLVFPILRLLCFDGDYRDERRQEDSNSQAQSCLAMIGADFGHKNLKQSTLMLLHVCSEGLKVSGQSLVFNSNRLRCKNP